MKIRMPRRSVSSCAGTRVAASTAMKAAAKGRVSSGRNAPVKTRATLYIWHLSRKIEPDLARPSYLLNRAACRLPSVYQSPPTQPAGLSEAAERSN